MKVGECEKGTLQKAAAPFYFDVLPIHPPLEYLESLTSYLMRLAEMNGILSVDGISTLCFPNQDTRITRGIADYPPVSFDDLVIAGASTEEMLRLTTFFHLAAKFGRSVLPQPISRFLSGCVGQYLRYCPVCLTEQQSQHYLLSWRFLMLTCCHQHRCRLLETCGHCERLIPLFIAPFKLGCCPICQRSLKLCPAVLVTDETELEATAQIQDDIVFLLTPQLWEVDSRNIIKQVGRRLACARHTRKLTAMEVASRIGITLTMIEGMERGNAWKGATFQSYFKYTRYLCLDFKEIFSDAIGAPDTSSSTVNSPLCPTCQQSSYVTRAGYNRSGSQRYQCQYCHYSFTVLPKAREAKRPSSVNSSLCPVCQQSSYVTRNGYNRSGLQRYQCQYCHHSFTALPKAREAKRLLP